MKRFILTLLLFPLLLSCQVRPSTNTDETSRLRAFCFNIVSTSIMTPVLLLEECDGNKSVDIFSPTFSFVRDDVEIEILSASDSTWKAGPALPSGNINFNTVIKMLPDNSFGLHDWSVGTDGLWSEEKGYKATMSTVRPSRFYWKVDSGTARISYYQVFSGAFEVTTSLNGKDIDRCTLTFSDYPAGGYSYSYGNYDFNVTHLR